jgi:ATP-binding cassette subfamily B protein
MPRNLKGSHTPAKNSKKALTDFIKYLGHYISPVVFASICAIVAAILNLLGPNQLSKITDLITTGLSGKLDLGAIGRIGWLLIWLYAGGFALNSLQSWVMATMTQKMTQKMRTDISEKINRLPLSYFDSHSTGDTLSRVTNDVDTVGQSMNQSIGQLISSAAMLIGSVIMMLITNWIMAVSGIISALIGFALTLVIIEKSQQYFLGQQQELGRVNGTVEETYSSLAIVKAYNAQKQAKQVFDQQNEKLYNFAWKSQFLSQMMMPLMQFVGNLAYVVVCVVGAILAKNGTISFGVIVAFMIYIRLFTQPLQNVAQSLSSLQQMAAACERVFEFLGESEMTDESSKVKQLTTVEGNVDFEHVKFGYDASRVIIHDFSEKVHAGQKIAIVGPTGAGKTTLVNLLMRFYEVNAGSISIDGISTQDITRENVHDLFGMVLQDTWLFEGTLRENLVYNQIGVSDKTLNEVCDATGLTDLVNQLPHGLDTVLDDNAEISAGQRQLITIARAMVKDAPLLILDEATSSVDTRTELKVQQAMDQLMQGRTSFVIAHRLSTIKNADKILVINNGDVIESGNHDELMQQQGFYADLYNSQFDPA